MHNAIQQFRDAIISAGLTAPDTIEADGKLHRFASNGKRGDDAGWYVLHDDVIPAGSFGDWRTDQSQTWRADIGRKLTPAEDAAHRAMVEAMQREREADRTRRQSEATRKAGFLWRAGAPAKADHPYLVRKRIAPAATLREITTADAVEILGYSPKWKGELLAGRLLVAPVKVGDALSTCELIDEAGRKSAIAGGAKAGGYWAAQSLHDGDGDGLTLLIGEGVATVLSAKEASGHPAIAALSHGNLPAVAKAMRERYPAAALIILADLKANGEADSRAIEAARAVGGKLAIPGFGASRNPDMTDFNDMALMCGVEAVERAIASASELATGKPQPGTEDAPAGNSDGWPEPQPIRAALHPVPPFDPVALLPDVLRDWVMDEAERMPCAPDFVAAAVVVALGATIGARCAIKPKARDSWLVVPNVWGGIVALPSAKKSPAIAAAMAPVDRLAAQAQAAHRDELEAFETDRVVSEARRDAIKDEIKLEAKKLNGGNVTAKAEELRRHKANAPQPPTLRRYRTNDATVEKLGELLRDNPAGLLVLRDELVGLLASWDREGREGDRAFFLEAWNGTGSFDTDRIGRGSILIPNLCVSIFGGIQPDKLTEYLEQAAHALGNDGTLQRFQLLVYPDARPWEWRDRAPNRQARDTAFHLFELLADFDPVAWGAIAADDATRFPHFRFDDEAQQVFIEWLHELQRERIAGELADGHPLIAQHLAKYEKLFAALALILHLAECAATGQRGPVTAASAIRAAAWCEYLEAHARRCYGLLADEGLRSAQALATRVERDVLADGFTARDVRRKRWRYLSSDTAVRAALEWLEDEGWLRGEASGGTGPGTGRRTDRYWINPKTREMANRGAAKAANRTLTAAMAAPHPSVSGDLTGAAHG